MYAIPFTSLGVILAQSPSSLSVLRFSLCPGSPPCPVSWMVRGHQVLTCSWVLPPTHHLDRRMAALISLLGDEEKPPPSPFSPYPLLRGNLACQFGWRNSQVAWGNKAVSWRHCSRRLGSDLCEVTRKQQSREVVPEAPPSRIEHSEAPRAGLALRGTCPLQSEGRWQ